MKRIFGSTLSLSKNLLGVALLFAAVQIASAQAPVSIPIMEVPTSADANGMGGIAASLPSDYAASTLANPAQLGIFSLSNFFNASTYATKPPAPLSLAMGNGANLNSSGANIGANLKQILGLPFELSLGAGYSRVFLDQGTIPITTEQNPDGIGTINLWERQESYTIGAGIDWFVKLGLGYNFKTVDLVEPAFNLGGAYSLNYNLKAHDYGFMVQIPVMEIASAYADHQIMLSPKLQPAFNINIGYSRRNIGDYPSTAYGPPTPSPALPRSVTLGVNFEFALKTTIENREWNLFSVTWAREAEDYLLSESFSSFYDSVRAPQYYIKYSYRSGLGNIQPIDNLILGRTYGKVDLRKGWQIQLADFLYLRSGIYYGMTFQYPTTTYGVTLKLNGLIKFLSAFDIIDIQKGPLAFLVDHFDLQYHYSEYGSGTNTGTTFKAINLVIK